MAPRVLASGSSAARGKAPTSGPSGSSRMARASSPSAASALGLSRAISALNVTGGDLSVDEGILRSSRLVAVQAASTPQELLACIPGAYREAMRGVIMDFMKTKRQLASAEKQLLRFQADKTSQIMPPPLRIKVPTVQYVKAFVVANPEVSNTFAASTTLFQNQLLDEAIRLKSEEVSFLRNRILLATPTEEGYDAQPTPSWQSIMSLLANVFDALHRNAKKPSWGPPTDDSHGRPVFTGWEQDDAVVSEYSVFLTDVPAILQRATSLVDDSLLAEENKAEKKRQLKDSAMMDVDEHITSQSIQSMIDKRVAEALKSKGKGKAPAKKPAKSAGPKAKAEASGPKPKPRGNAAGKGRDARRAKGRQGAQPQQQQQQQNKKKGKGSQN